MEPQHPHPHYQPPPKSRPVIITVFGILTFIGSGIVVISSLITILGDQTDLYFTDPGMLKMMYAITMLFSFGKIFGVVRMFSMKRVGFYIYTVSEMITVVIYLLMAKDQAILLSAQIDMDPETYVTITTIVTVAFSLLWIGAYASQINKME